MAGRAALLPFLAVSILMRWWTAALLFVIVALAVLLILQRIRLASRRRRQPRRIGAWTAAGPGHLANPTLATLFVLLLITVAMR